MTQVTIKAVEGRVARVSPRGHAIPHDRYVTVPLTPYLDRLINVHKDVTEKPDVPVSKDPEKPLSRSVKSKPSDAPVATEE